MKAKKTPQEEVDLASMEPILKTEEIAVQFPNVQEKIEKYNRYSLSLQIEDDDTLKVAENTSSEVHEIYKNVEKVRQVLKGPYFQTAKNIDEYAKTITGPLTAVKKRINDEIANYRTVQAAMLRAKQEEEMARIAALEAEKKDELSRITRIEQQLNGRIYGGFWLDKNKMKQSSSGCIKETDCDELLNVIVTKVPKPDTYKHFPTQHEEMISNVKKRLAEHKINLHNLNGDSRILREDAMKKIAEAKVSAGIMSDEAKEQMEKKIEKEIKGEVRTFEKSVAEAGKGVRKILKFVVTEPAKVPRDFFEISEDKIRDHMNANNEKIRKDLLENRESIPGIKFYIDDSYASR